MQPRVPYDADEKTTLWATLNAYRDTVLWKLEGLDDEQLRRPMTPSGTNLIGLVKHLAAAEYGWFCETFGRETEPLPDIDSDPEADMSLAPGEEPGDAVAFYGRARAAAGATIGELALEDAGVSWSGNQVTLRWVLVHMVEEVARHAGHMDICRELIDGATGGFPPRPATDAS
jgi:uncharacterized damage-inducible protein DinB